jgi:hypothetical protein
MQMRRCDRGEMLSPKTGLAEQYTLQTRNGCKQVKTSQQMEWSRGERDERRTRPGKPYGQDRGKGLASQEG